MASVVVETGLGVANADSYTSVAAATAYHATRGQADAWDAIDDKDAALRKATDYIERTYRGRWAGMRFTNHQALDWPRQGVPWPDSPNRWRPFDVVPAEIQNACAEFALKTASGDLMVDLGRETIHEGVGSLKVSYRPGSSRQQRYDGPASMLREFLVGGGSGYIAVARA